MPSEQIGSTEPPIIIVRRSRAAHDGGHHGGVWKIAFADFMTAMMAFFLVLWIVNSTTKETRISLARYFNPIQMAEKSAQKRGVEEPSQARPLEYPGDVRENKDASAVSLAKAAGIGSGEGSVPGEHPFTDVVEDEVAIGKELFGRNVSASVASKKQTAERSQARDQIEKHDGLSSQSFISRGLAELEREVSEYVQSGALERPKELMPTVTLARTGDGLRIILTDNEKFSMFAVGSSTLNTRAQALMKRIAAMLATRPGPIVIGGHTDGRNFQRGKGNNWQLSAERASASAQSLVRHGVSTKRIEKLEAFGDSQPKLADPLAAENRRIEIWLRGQ